MRLAKEIMRKKELVLLSLGLETTTKGSSNIYYNKIIGSLSKLRISQREKTIANKQESLYIEYYLAKGIFTTFA